jgi:hypothetical protein
VARRLAQHLDAPLVASGYSRLVIDCNRPLTSEESIAITSAGMVVPGNAAIGAADRALRAKALFAPIIAPSPKCSAGRLCCELRNAAFRQPQKSSVACPRNQNSSHMSTG